MKHEPKRHNDDQCNPCTDAGWQKRSARGSNSDDNEHNLDAFQHDNLECGSSCRRVPVSNSIGLRLAEGVGLACEYGILVMKRDDARRPQDGLTEPPHPK